MVLFKSLANTEIEELSSSSTDKTPAFPPTAIQLYSTKYIHFISHSIQHYQTNDKTNEDSSQSMTANHDNANANSNANANANANHQKRKDPKLKLSVKDLKSLPKEYELLSYQPIYVPDDSNTMTATTTITGNNTAAATANSTSPNLGVWDCRCSSSLISSKTTTGMTTTPFLLQSSLSHCNISGSDSGSGSDSSISSCKPTFVITIDLESLEEIQPLLSSMMSSIFQSMKSIIKEKTKGAGKIITVTTTTTTTTNNEKVDNVIVTPSVNGDTNNNDEQKTNDNDNNDDIISSLPQFGMAPSLQKNESSGELKSSSYKHFLLEQMNIVICAILPYYQEEDTVKYKQKQGLNLVLYHLLKYANDLNCTLCFLNQNDCSDSGNESADGGDGDGGDNDGSGNHEGDNHDEAGDGLNRNKKRDRNGLVPDGLSVKEFAYLIRGICLGDETIVSSIYGQKTMMDSDNDNDNKEEEEEEKGEKGDTTANGMNEFNQQQEQSSIYLPNGYDVDLIDSVYLRSASCAGFWDANTDSLWVALPPPSSSGATSLMDSGSSLGITKLDKISEDEKVDGKGGDEEWLSKLAESISAYTGGMGGDGDGRSTTRSISEDSSIKSSKTKGTKGTRVGFKDGSTVMSSKTTKTTSTRKRVARPSKKSSSDEKEEAQDFFKGLL